MLEFKHYETGRLNHKQCKLNFIRLKDSYDNKEYVSEKRLTVMLSETKWSCIPERVYLEGKLKSIEFIFEKMDTLIVVYRPSSRALSVEPICSAYRLYVNRDV